MASRVLLPVTEVDRTFASEEAAYSQRGRRRTTSASSVDTVRHSARAGSPNRTCVIYATSNDRSIPLWNTHAAPATGKSSPPPSVMGKIEDENQSGESVTGNPLCTLRDRQASLTKFCSQSLTSWPPKMYPMHGHYILLIHGHLAVTKPIQQTTTPTPFPLSLTPPTPPAPSTLSLLPPQTAGVARIPPHHYVSSTFRNPMIPRHTASSGTTLASTTSGEVRLLYRLPPTGPITNAIHY